MLGGWATGGARTDAWPVSDLSYPEVTGCGKDCTGCGVKTKCRT